MTHMQIRRKLLTEYDGETLTTNSAKEDRAVQCWVRKRKRYILIWERTEGNRNVYRLTRQGQILREIKQETDKILAVPYTVENS